MKNNGIVPLVIMLLGVGIAACNKPAGPGGKATIKGKVFAIDKDNQQFYTVSSGYSPDVRVYIVYGNNTVIGNDVRTSYDGSYEFRHLNKGKYKVYVNSLDTMSKYKGNDTYIPIVKEVTINSPSQVVTLEDFRIAK